MSPTPVDVRCNLGDVPPDEDIRIDLEFGVDPSTPYGSVLFDQTFFDSETPLNLFPAADFDPSEELDVVTVADVEVTKMSEPEKVNAGEQKRYQIWVENFGPSDAQDVVVYDVLPDEVEFEIDTSRNMCTQPDNLVGLRAVLLPENEVPEVTTSSAMGLATFILNTDTNELTYSVQLSDIDNVAGAAGIHIHAGQSTVNGGVLAWLYDGTSAPVPSPTQPLVGVVSLDATLADSLEMMPDQHYVNVHTTDFAGGEIRGQLSATLNAPLKCDLGVMPAHDPTPMDAGPSDDRRGRRLTVASTSTSGHVCCLRRRPAR